MKKFLILIIVLCGCGQSQPLPVSYDTRAAQAGDNILVGDSISRYCEFYFNGLNRAVPGARAAEALQIVEKYSLQDIGGVYYILIGTNDIKLGREDDYYSTINKIAKILQDENVTFISVLPTSWDEHNVSVIKLNGDLKQIASMYGFNYMDVYDNFTNSKGLLKTEYNADGIHLTNAGCQKLFGSIE